MPSRPDCDHCPFRDDTETPCVVLETGHLRFCTAIDPEGGSHVPRMRDAVVRLTLESLGRFVPEPVAPPTFPPLAARARNLAGAVVAAVTSGGKQVTPDERERRLSICRGCEHFDAEEMRCRRCGCQLSLKVRLQAWHCPLSPPKW